MTWRAGAVLSHLRHESSQRNSNIARWFSSLGLMVVSLAAVMLLLPPIPQDQSITNSLTSAAGSASKLWNVLSSSLYAAIGAVGLWQFRDNPAAVSAVPLGSS
jgi:hypothetical protein